MILPDANGNDEMYIIGGKSSDDNIYSPYTIEKVTKSIRNECDINEKAVGCLTEAIDLSVPIFAHCAVIFDGSIWVIGGDSGDGATATVYKFTDGALVDAEKNLKVAR